MTYCAVPFITMHLFFAIEPEEPTVKVGLMKKNYAMVQENRFHNNITSILFKDGLKLNKRKCEEFNEQNVVSVTNIVNSVALV